MDIQRLMFFIALANFALTWGVALYMYLSNKNKATNDRIDKLERAWDEKSDDHASRIAALEGVNTRAPTHDDLGRLYERLNATTEGLKHLQGQLSSMSDTLRLILSRMVPGAKGGE